MVPISGPQTVIVNTNQQYSVDPSIGTNFTWSVSGGMITSGQGTPLINVLWQVLGQGSVSVNVDLIGGGQDNGIVIIDVLEG
jgi:hypothetical protein